MSGVKRLSTMKLLFTEKKMAKQCPYFHSVCQVLLITLIVAIYCTVSCLLSVIVFLFFSRILCS